MIVLVHTLALWALWGNVIILVSTVGFSICDALYHSHDYQGQVPNAVFF